MGEIANVDDSRNRYIFCHLNGKASVFSLDAPGRFDFDDAYFVKALREMERLGVEGRTFLFAYDARVPLPCKGPDVVVIIYGDERRLIPPYLNEVGAVFTCFGMTPSGRCAPLLTRQGLLEVADVTRRVAQWIPGAARRAAQSLQGQRTAPVTRIPLGYQKLEPTPFVPLAERPYLLSFLGSIVGTTGRSLRTLLGTPKRAARSTLVSVLEEMKAAGAPVEIGVTAGYRDSLARGPGHFSSVLMNTKICPVPRGTTLETARLFAAAKSGCVVVAERQPRSWFCDRSPVVTVRHWRQLPGLVAELAADPVRMEELHRKSLAWWEEVCSEPALGRMMARSLGTPAGRGARPGGADAMSRGAPALRRDGRGLA